MYITEETSEKFKVVYNSQFNVVGVIVSDVIDIFYVPDCCASQAAFMPVDLENKDSYNVLRGVVVQNLSNQALEVWSFKENLRYLSGNEDGYIAYDAGSAQLKLALSLIKFAGDKLYEKKIQDANIEF